MAPASNVDLYHSHYLPILQGKRNLTIQTMNIDNLRDKLERDDNVVKIYRKSLLYLVSRSFERTGEKPLLGMEMFNKQVKQVPENPFSIFTTE